MHGVASSCNPSYHVLIHVFKVLRVNLLPFSNHKMLYQDRGPYKIIKQSVFALSLAAKLHFKSCIPFKNDKSSCLNIRVAIPYIKDICDKSYDALKVKLVHHGNLWLLRCFILVIPNMCRFKFLINILQYKNKL